MSAESHGITRFGVSMPEDLLARFDKVIQRKGYANRSEALRDLVRDHLIEDRAAGETGNVVGALVMVYDHETRALGDRLTHMQHEAGHLVISTMHVHLNHHDCLEVLALSGPGDAVRALADHLLSLKGVKHGKLLITGSGDA